MPIQYQVVPNALTSPPSYTGRVAPKSILGITEIAHQINIHNPTITEEIAKTVITAFQEEVLFQLAEGNTVKIASFCSFSTSLPFRIAAATDALPPGVVDIKAKPSAPFKTQLRQDARFTRLPYSDKAPTASEVVDTNSGLAGWIRDNFGFRINGANIGFDVSDAALGMSLTLADGTVVQQGNIGLNDPSSVIIVPSFESDLPDGEHVEVTLVMSNRYTENGQVRIGTITNKIRATNASGSYFSVAMETSPVSLTSFTGADDTALLVSAIKPDGTLTIAGGSVDGELGQVYDILPATASVDIAFGTHTVTVAIDDYDSLMANVLAYQRYMQEVIVLETP